jgi:predicted DsbA family dithiol-disulfide isomerase
VKRALLQAYHGEGRNPSSMEVLLEAAAAAGLDAARAREILAGDAYAGDVRAREALWRERGVNGVPLLLVNDRYALEGAQPPEAYAQALRQIASEG